MTHTRIFVFWIPLAAMWLMMALEQPIIAAVVARMRNPELNLAAFGVTFSLALFVESPIIMLLTAGTALARDPVSYRRLLRFTHILAGGLTVLHLLIALTPLFRLIVRGVIGAPEDIVELSRNSFLLVTPWTAAIAYRRLWQGVLIRFNRTAVVPITIATRLAISACLLVAGMVLDRIAGVYVASIALSIGVTAAAVTAYGFCRPIINHLLPRANPQEEPIGWKELIRFYVPLALTSMILLATRPILNIGLARSPMSMMSLATWPVIIGVMFLGRSMALSYQEAVVALLKDRRSLDLLSRFTGMLALSLLILFSLVVATPFGRFWFERVAGLSPVLAAFSLLPTAVLMVLPAISAIISFQRGVLIHVKHTTVITRSVLVNVGMLGAVMLVLGALVPLPGAVLAAIALTASVLSEWAYLFWRVRSVLHRLRGEPAGAGGPPASNA